VVEVAGSLPLVGLGAHSPEPEEARVLLDLVREGAVGAVAAAGEEMATDGGG